MLPDPLPPACDNGRPMADRYVEHLLWRKSPEAVEQLARAALSTPNAPQATRTELEVALAYALMYQYKFSEAAALMRDLLARTPSPDAAMCLAQLAFYMNEPFPDPWDKLEARWGVGWTGDRPVPDDRRWDGSPLAGRSVLLAAEGGLGDQVQYVRFAPLVKRGGAGRLIVSAKPALLALFETIAGVDAVVPTMTASNRPAAPVEYDVALPMLSAPRFLCTAMDAVPPPVVL